ncbi:hypothetical protein JCM10908_001142 [Rhodotorula pacifica]|uniref:uncharacterized protein n=1 Tax=Rhodotorula pacifica TaxID=1495444 RepID=UPI00318017BA
MGVQSLTTYVKKHNLGSYIYLPDPLGETGIPLVVDGMAWAYNVGLVDTFQGGSYAAIRANTRRYIEYWRACGLEPEVVWDGPFDSSKLATVISRSEQSLQRSINYMRAPDSLRGDCKFWSKITRLPPMAHMAIAAELEALGVPNHCAEGEADSPTAELAQRRNGFVLSNDSDYFIYPAQCRGYIPLTSVTYGSYNSARLETVPISEPPSMQLLVYQPSTIARSFSLPVTFLPLLAALIGNDIANYAAEINTKRAATNRTAQWPGRVDPRELLRIAGALSTCANMPVETLAQLQDVVFAVLPRLLSRPSNDPLIVANLATAAWSYRLDSLDTPQLFYPLHPRVSDTPAQAAARASYDAAYRSSRLSSFVLHVLKHGTVLLQGSVEMPEYQSPVVSLAGPIRRWIYAVVRETIGTGAMERGGMPEVVYEYARRGEALLPAQVAVPALAALLVERGIDPSTFCSSSDRPLLALPPPTRLALLFAVTSFPAGILELASQAPSAPAFQPYLPLLLALHHIQLTHALKRPWTSHELRCAMFVAVLLRVAPTSIPALIAAAKKGRPRLVAPRRSSIQRGVELVVTLVALNILAQVLLLPTAASRDRETEGVRWTEPHYLYDGAALHAFFELEEATLRKVMEGSPAVIGTAVDAIMKVLEASTVAAPHVVSV